MKKLLCLLAVLFPLTLLGQGVSRNELRNTNTQIDARIALKANTTTLLAVSNANYFASRASNSMGIYNVLDYGVTTNGVDGSLALLKLITNAMTAGGGTLFFPPGTYLITNKLTIPNDGTTPPRQNALRFTGASSWKSGQGGAINGGSILELRHTNSVAKIDTRGLGHFEIDHLTLANTGGDGGTPFIQTTLTTLYIHNAAFIGKNSGTAANEDAIVLGGTNTVATTGADAPFQGYGTVIADNYFNKIRRGAYLRTYANAIQIRDNTWWNECGGIAAIEIVGDHGNSSGGNIISGNLIEVGNYTNVFRLTRAVHNSFIGNNLYDSAVGFPLAQLALVSDSPYNFLLEGFAEDSYAKVSGDSDNTTVLTSHQSETNRIPNVYRFAMRPLFAGAEGPLHTFGTNYFFNQIETVSLVSYWKGSNASAEAVTSQIRSSAGDKKLEILGTTASWLRAPSSLLRVASASGTELWLGDTAVQYFYILNGVLHAALAGAGPAVKLPNGTGLTWSDSSSPSGASEMTIYETNGAFYFVANGISGGAKVASVGTNGTLTVSNLTVTTLTGSGPHVTVDAGGLFSRTTISGGSGLSSFKSNNVPVLAAPTILETTNGPGNVSAFSTAIGSDTVKTYWAVDGSVTNGMNTRIGTLEAAGGTPNGPIGAVQFAGLASDFRGTNSLLWTNDTLILNNPDTTGSRYLYWSFGNLVTPAFSVQSTTNLWLLQSDFGSSGPRFIRARKDDRSLAFGGIGSLSSITNDANVYNNSNVVNAGTTTLLGPQTNAAAVNNAAPVTNWNQVVGMAQFAGQPSTDSYGSTNQNGKFFTLQSALIATNQTLIWPTNGWNGLTPPFFIGISNVAGDANGTTGQVVFTASADLAIPNGLVTNNAPAQIGVTKTNFTGASNIASLVLVSELAVTNVVEGNSLDSIGSSFFNNGVNATNTYRPVWRRYVVPTVGGSVQTLVEMSATNSILVNGEWIPQGPWATNSTLTSAGNSTVSGTLGVQGTITTASGDVDVGGGVRVVTNEGLGWTDVRLTRLGIGRIGVEAVTPLSNVTPPAAGVGLELATNLIRLPAVSQPVAQPGAAYFNGVNWHLAHTNMSLGILATNWYQIPLIQAGQTNVTAATSVAINFPKYMPTANYTVNLSADAALVNPFASAQTVSNFVANFSVLTGNVFWSVTQHTQ